MDRYWNAGFHGSGVRAALRRPLSPGLALRGAYDRSSDFDKACCCSGFLLNSKIWTWDRWIPQFGEWRRSTANGPTGAKPVAPRAPNRSFQ